MKKILLLVVWISTMGMLQAQNNLITYSEPIEAKGLTTEVYSAKVIILSPNKDVIITHNMGVERGILTGREKNGEYRYELTHKFSEDEQEDGFCKTTVTVSTVQGSKNSVLVLRSGKCYIGSFEIPFKFSCVDESNVKAVYSYENRAKVSFMSEENDLQIKCNGTIFVDNGEPNTNLNYVEVKTGKDKDNPELTVYEFIFDLSKPEAKTAQFKNPHFTVRSSFPTALDVQLRDGVQLSSKTIYKFRVLLQLVETVIKTKKVLTSATMQLLANGEQASKDRKYVAAHSFFQQALDSLKNETNTSVNKVALEENVTHMKECAEWDQKAAKYMQYIKQLKEGGGDDKMSTIEDAFRQTLVCYTNLDRLHPDPIYKTFIAKINKSLETFNFIVIEGTVRDRKDNTKIITGGLDVYGVSSSTFEKDMQKKAQGTRVGTVDADGKFRVQVEKNTYQGLLFVPISSNKDYDKNGFVSLTEQKHLKSTVYISE